MKPLAVLYFAGSESDFPALIREAGIRFYFSEPLDRGLFDDIQGTIRKARGDALRFLQRDEKCVFMGRGSGALTALLLATELPADGVVCLSVPLDLRRKTALFTGLRLKDQQYSGAQIRRLYSAMKRTEYALSSLHCPILSLADPEDSLASAKSLQILRTETVDLAEKEIRLIRPGESSEETIVEFLKRVSEMDPIN